MTRRVSRNSRRGNVLVLTCFMMIGLLAMVAFAVDLGYLQMAKTELQASADSAALAAAWDLMDGEVGTSQAGLSDEISQARTRAVAFAAYNKVCTQSPTVNPNTSNTSSGDVVVGFLSDLNNKTQALSFANPNAFNVVQVKVRRQFGQNGEVPLFFGRIFGQNSKAMEATATAGLFNTIGGFKITTSSQGNVMLLPFALDEDTWNALLGGTGSDSYCFDSSSNCGNGVSTGGDGVKEVNLYPQGTGSPGNRGTIDIGSSNNSTADIARQIVDGISQSDLSYHGGELKFNNSGELHLNGDTGISAGVKDELASIIGQTRIIPIFRSVTGPGNNADYKIVKFCGVRIMYVKLTGSMSSKKLMVQPANVVTQGAIYTTTTGTSNYVYSPAYLIR